MSGPIATMSAGLSVAQPVRCSTWSDHSDLVFRVLRKSCAHRTHVCHVRSGSPGRPGGPRRALPRLPGACMPQYLGR